MHPAIEPHMASTADALARSQYLWLSGVLGCSGIMAATTLVLWFTGAKDMVQALAQYWKTK